MTVSKTYCDICGDEINDDREWNRIVQIDEGIGEFGEFNSETYDMCERCYGEFCRIVSEFIRVHRKDSGHGL